MIEKKWLGSKTKQGFYKKVKDENGKSKILSLDLKTLEYKDKQKVKFPTLDMTRSIDNLVQRTKVLYNGMDKAGEFYRKSFNSLFAYVSNRIPEISDDLYKIDDQFEIYIPTERAINPITGTNWEGIGVIPDIIVPSEYALDTTIVLAKKAGAEFAKAKDAKLKLYV